MEEETISSELIHQGQFLKYTHDIVKLSNNNIASREVIWHNGGVVIVPYIRDTDSFVLVEQYRYAIGQRLFEFPAGKLESGENPEHTAQRELLEETGYISNNLKFLGDIFPAPGFCSERLYLYYTDNLILDKSNPEEDEILNIHIVQKNRFKRIN